MTTPTEKESISLKAKDILLLIKAAKTAGLTHFRYGNLEFSLKSEEKVVQNDNFSPEMSVLDQNNKEKYVKPEEDILDDLMIVDPVAYEAEIEKRLAAGEEV